MTATVTTPPPTAAPSWSTASPRTPAASGSSPATVPPAPPPRPLLRHPAQPGPPPGPRRGRHDPHPRLPGPHRPGHRRAAGEYTDGLLLDYLALGIDPARSTVFNHSAVPALNQLLLPFLSLVSVAELSRNPTVKDEIAHSRQSVVSGLMLTYPVHQAADILSCKGNVVPVGQDQLPHLELTRTIARRFNERYGNVFPEPDALLSAAPLLLGTDGTKMSKSRANSVPRRHRRRDGPPGSRARPRTPTGTSPTTPTPAPASPPSSCWPPSAWSGTRTRSRRRSATAGRLFSSGR